MKLEEVPPNMLAKMAKFHWDRIIEKHEGPEDWDYLLKDDYVEFLNVDGFEVLLPIGRENHKNINITRCIASNEGNTLTIFLEDTTFDTGMFAGYLAVCEKIPEQPWFIAIVYHECWVSRLEAVG
jgi:hypothetical protein